ncbi:uncharacterized protein SPSK_10820 [Sporothrix schenckii 1099-18]|uniref:Uncharacterized protein n=1 Tax=Sporothrix schenckii 1099-18 TaxID=1397361 RepID=A0A0F2MFC3_SPOSC|nr:uncharacterized protein SPSK_10820 [Sporothrix schenckii 1099-18]KJR88398.1 hypothetical protein SPSK_10820 [Sporothrix schenckii 1099-18]
MGALFEEGAVLETRRRQTEQRTKRKWLYDAASEAGGGLLGKAGEAKSELAAHSILSRQMPGGGGGKWQETEKGKKSDGVGIRKVVGEYFRV